MEIRKHKEGCCPYCRNIFNAIDRHIKGAMCCCWHQSEMDSLKDSYNELIMAVGNKYKDETRHETALRYIKQAEYDNDGVAKTEVEDTNGDKGER